MRLRGLVLADGVLTEPAVADKLEEVVARVQREVDGPAQLGEVDQLERARL